LWNDLQSVSLNRRALGEIRKAKYCYLCTNTAFEMAESFSDVGKIEAIEQLYRLSAYNPVSGLA
jgi:hypothetical protein